MRFIIVRHAESEWNLKKIIQGQLDSPITDRGYRQIAALAESLKNNTVVSQIICSPLGRAQTTAYELAKYFNCSVETDVRLSEQNFGIFQGLPDEIIFRDYPELASGFFSGNPNIIAPEGESTLSVISRIISCLLDNSNSKDHKVVCVVTHGFALQALTWHLNGQNSDEETRKYGHDSCAYSIIDIKNNCIELVNWGLASHLIHI